MLNIYNQTMCALVDMHKKKVIGMAGTPRQKQKTLHLLRILFEKTDGEHALTLAELAEELRSAGIESERKSLYRDLAALNDAGFSVGTVRSKETRYYWADRPLKKSDFRLLSNLLRIAPVVPRKRKPELERKLRSLSPHGYRSDAFADLISVIPDSAVTERVYSNVETLFDAICNGFKVRFLYRASRMMENSPRKKSRYQTVSPYRMVWHDGYYLVGADEDDSFVFYRVDRMEEVKQTPYPTKDLREIGGDLDFDLNQYIKGYFSSLQDPVHMIFRVSDDFLAAAEHYFPPDCVVESAADGSYLLTCDLPADETLFGWLLLHSEDIRLLYPASVLDQLREFSRCAAAVYGGETGENAE